MSDEPRIEATIAAANTGCCLHCAVWRAVAMHFGGSAAAPTIVDPVIVRQALAAVLADLMVNAPPAIGARFIADLGDDLAAAIVTARDARRGRAMQ